MANLPSDKPGRTLRGTPECLFPCPTFWWLIDTGVAFIVDEQIKQLSSKFVMECGHVLMAIYLGVLIGPGCLKFSSSVRRHIIGEAASALNVKELKNLEGILEKRISGIRSKKDIFWQEPLEEFVIALTECLLSREKIM
ncbi:hypothetical protein ACLB2K_013768 [Fragaria x ananassa]